MNFETTHSAAFEDKTSLSGASLARACGKLRYPDKKAAVTFLNSFRHERGRHGRPEWLRAYPCPDCGGWHVTKGKAKKADRIKIKKVHRRKE
jgi:hypothetical protein